MSTTTHVTFPGLGLDFNLNKVAFSIGNLSVRWYGIIISVGIILAFAYFLRRAVKTEGLAADHVYNITLIAVIVAIIGARFTYVITNLDKYDTFWEMINVSEGGIAIYGAIIFGGAAVIIYSKIKKLNIYAVLDSLAPAVLLGQIIGRWGNFVNGEAYGYSAGAEKLPWRMGLDVVRINDVYRSDIKFVHPTFLYESLWNLIGFVIISVIYKKKKFNGQIFYFYVAWYGIGRGFIELLRTDSLYIVGDIKLSVVIGFLSFAAAAIMLVLLSKRASRELKEAAAYESKYAALKVESGEDGLSAAADEVPDTPDTETLEEQDSLDGDAGAENETDDKQEQSPDGEDF